MTLTHADVVDDTIESETRSCRYAARDPDPDAVLFHSRPFLRLPLNQASGRREDYNNMLRRVTDPLRQFGFFPGLLYLADRTLRRLSSHLGLYVYELMVQPIGSKPLLSEHHARNLRHVQMDRGHPEVDTMPARPEIKASRFDQGAVCLGVYAGEKLIGYSWFCFNAYREDEVRCTYELALPDESVFDFDFYVLPEHRMGFGFMAVWHTVNQFLRMRGIRYTFSRVTRFNMASRRAHARLGAKCIGRTVVLQAWGFEGMLATVKPYAWISWRSTPRPRIRLAPPSTCQAETVDGP